MATATEPGLHKDPVAEQKAMSGAQKRALESLEAKWTAGGRVRTPKGALLELPKGPDGETDARLDESKYTYRWGHKRVREKMETHKYNGYEVVPDAEGGTSLGDDFVLIRTSRRNAAERQKYKEQRTREMLKAPEAEFDGALEGERRRLHDAGRHEDARKLGVRVSDDED